MVNIKQIFACPVNRVIISKLLSAWLERANVEGTLPENHINRNRFELLHYSKLKSR